MAKPDVGQWKAALWFGGMAEARRRVIVSHEARLWPISQGPMQAEEMHRCELNSVAPVMLGTGNKRA